MLATKNTSKAASHRLLVPSDFDQILVFDRLECLQSLEELIANPPLHAGMAD